MFFLALWGILGSMIGEFLKVSNASGIQENQNFRKPRNSGKPKILKNKKSEKPKIEKNEKFRKSKIQKNQKFRKPKIEKN